jgi:hypothetical protein
MITLSAENYAGRTRNPEWERALARELRSHPEADRLRFITDLLDVHQVVALELSRKCLEEKKSFEALLELGLRKGDASSIQDWLKCVLPHLGARHVVQYLCSRRGKYPQGVEQARYWLPGLMTSAERSSVDLRVLEAS